MCIEGVYRTSLGEESAEAMVRIGGLALVGEETVGLSKQIRVSSGQRIRFGVGGSIPECRARGSRAITKKKIIVVS